MQVIVEKIFQRVKEHPEFAPDLHKFMEYYLPTTVKLLGLLMRNWTGSLFREKTLKTAKRRLMKTLGTLNLAFENCWTALFEDTAWDVATDISVLQTMLAQEGLTEPGMKAGS